LTARKLSIMKKYMFTVIHGETNKTDMD